MTNEFISYAAIIISALSATGTLLAYYKFNRRLKQQQIKLNEYELERRNNEELQSRCANLSVTLTSNRIIVSNYGQAEATEIELTFPADILIGPPEFPIKIKSIAPGESFKIEISRATTNRKFIPIDMTWLDGRGVRQSARRNVSLV
ncbi:MAG: hypothetical protein HDR79_02925 [Bacteroides sp.]|nr:hypothetical protein [Bacteroides sp.]MBD5363888.1 hypothetical protein [Bacteroides sp.]MBD5372759.1 hypothetical protein [Bacteroides sp.]